MLQPVAIQTAAGQTIEVLEPADRGYRCRDEHAPILLLVPGLGLDGLAFVRQLPLGAVAHLQLFQMPNEAASGEAGLWSYAHHVEEYIAARKLERHPGGLVLGGNSLGGVLSLLVAARARVKLRGLVLMGTYGSCRHLPRWQRCCAPLTWLMPFGPFRRMGWRIARWKGCATNAEARWMRHSRLRRTQGYFGRSINALARLNCLDEARRIAIPALILHGTRDRVLPFAAAVELQEKIAGAELVSIGGAGHSLFFTHAAAVNTAIARMIAGLA